MYFTTRNTSINTSTIVCTQKILCDFAYLKISTSDDKDAAYASHYK